MSDYVKLNNVDHKDLKVDTTHKTEYGDNATAVPTFPTEFEDIQREYPIFLQKHPQSGKYMPVAMLGIVKGQSLFLDESKGGNNWAASYVPASLAKGPFLIGFEDQTAEGGSEHAPVVFIDMDDSRVNDQGTAVFAEHGGNSPYLETVNRVLQGIHQGMAMNDAMMDAFVTLDLIEPISLEIELNNGERHHLQGNYTINEEKLAGLRGKQLEELHSSGFLRGAHLVLASLNNVKYLIDKQNAIS